MPQPDTGQPGTADRARDGAGRPEQARPRDHTGQPLPHGSPEPARGWAQEHEVESVEEALALAVEVWGRGRYFEAHELLEHVWHHAPAEEREFWKGVIQVAVTHVMGQRRRPRGVHLTAAKAREKFDGVPPDHHGMDVPSLLQQLDEAERRAAQGEPATEPPFPSLPGGPWFDRAVGHTPLTREPPWLVASRELAERADRADRGERR